MPTLFPSPRIYGLTYTARFPSHLYARPHSGPATFLIKPRWRIWPVHYYAAGIEIEALNEADAIKRGAAELGCHPHDVRLALLPAERRVA